MHFALLGVVCVVLARCVDIMIERVDMRVDACGRACVCAYMHNAYLTRLRASPIQDHSGSHEGVERRLRMLAMLRITTAVPRSW